MDRLIVLDKLDSLQRCLQRVEAARADSVEVLRADVNRQDIISLNLARAVQLCVDLALHIIAARGGRIPEYCRAQLPGHRLGHRARHHA